MGDGWHEVAPLQSDGDVHSSAMPCDLHFCAWSQLTVGPPNQQHAWFPPPQLLAPAQRNVVSPAVHAAPQLTAPMPDLAQQTLGDAQPPSVPHATVGPAPVVALVVTPELDVLAFVDDVAVVVVVVELVVEPVVVEPPLPTWPKKSRVQPASNASPTATALQSKSDLSTTRDDSWLHLVSPASVGHTRFLRSSDGDLRG